MRRFMVFAIAMMVSVGMVSDAEAGKKKKKGGDDSADEDKGLELNLDSGIESVDSIFKKAQAPMDTLHNAEMKLDAVPASVNTALGLGEGTPLADALAELKTKAEGKIKVGMEDGGVPKVSLEDGVPDDVKAAVEGLNTSVSEAVSAVMGLTEVPGQVTAVIDEAKAFDPTSIKPVTAVPKATKAIGGNLKVLGAVPGEVQALGESLDNIKKELLNGLNG